MSDTTITRAFQIIELLEGDRNSITPEEAAAALGATRSTTYRYIKTLCDLGFLAQLTRGAYALGPRIVELERRLQISDPLLNSARPVMAAHAGNCPGSVLLLCSLWGEKVLCIHTELSDPEDSDALKLERARGLPFPLFKGAASLAILAHMPIAKRRSLYLRRSDQVAQFGLGRTWAEFRDATSKLHAQDVITTSDTFGSNLAAMALPILDEKSEAIGSITRILSAVRAEKADVQAEIAEDLKQIVAGINERLERYVGASRAS